MVFKILRKGLNINRVLWPTTYKSAAIRVSISGTSCLAISLKFHKNKKNKNEATKQLHIDRLIIHTFNFMKHIFNFNNEIIFTYNAFGIAYRTVITSARVRLMCE